MAKRSRENIDPDLDDFKVKKKKKLGPNNRFKLSSRQEETDMITKGYLPMNTQRSTAWSMKVFQEWKYSRSTDDDGECPSDLFEVGDPDNLNFWVPQFINEVRRADGDPYPPRTIHQLLAGLQCSMLDHNNRLPKFLDRTNPVFRPIHSACDSVYHSLHCAGIGTSVRHTAIISEEEEAKLWEKGILCVDNPKSLQRAVFYFIGKRFCIRSGEEQRQLGPRNFVRSYNPDCLTYIEHGSKNYSARAKDLHYENKEVPCPAIAEERPKCLVFLMDFYQSKLPPFAFENSICI